MSHVRKFLVGTGVVFAVLIASAGPAYAHDCFNASKTSGAGSGGTVVIGVDGDGNETFEFVPSGKPGNPAFVTLDLSGLGAGTWENVYAHPAGPRGVLPAAGNCDGKGIDSVEACLSL